jgi:hypothetical protein
MIQRLFLRIAALAALVSIPLAFSVPASAAETCDRACLAGFVTQYVDALVARDSSKLPLAENARFVEDSKAVKLGEGLWKTVTAKGQFRQDYLDTKKQVAASHVVVMEGQNPALCSILLHIQDRKIIGVETLIQRITPDSRFQPKELDKPVRGMNDPVPAGKKQSRESMIKTALTYPEGLRVGSFIDGGTPFANETYRVENGVVTAGGGCGRGDCGMYAQNIMVHPSIIANVAAVDEENGVVLLWMNFGYTASYGEGNSLVTFEAFKVWGGQIHSINAFFRPLPVGTGRYWPSSDPVHK